jgi:hypothetical protein
MTLRRQITATALTVLVSSLSASHCAAAPPQDQPATLPSLITEECLRFNAEPLKRVVATINRYNVRQLSIVDPAIKKLRIGGVICPTHLEKLIRGLGRVGISVVDADPELSASPSVILLAGTRTKLPR